MALNGELTALRARLLEAVTRQGFIDDYSGVRGHAAFAFSDRAQCGAKLLALAKPADRIVIMGARDDTLSTFAAELLVSIGA